MYNYETTIETNYYRVRDDLIYICKAFKALSTKRKPLRPSVLAFDGKNTGKIFLKIGYDFIGHITVRKHKFDIELKKFIKDLYISSDHTYIETEFFFKEQLNATVPDNMVNLDNVVYLDKEETMKFIRISRLKDMSSRTLKNEFKLLHGLEKDRAEGRTLRGEEKIDENEDEIRQHIVPEVELETKEQLENKSMNVYEKEPRTNSLAMSKDFKIPMRYLYRMLVEVLLDHPLMMKDVKWGVYWNEEIENYTKFAHIGLELFNLVMARIPVSDDEEIYTARASKMREYTLSFKNMSKWLYDMNNTEDFMAVLTRRRNDGTNRIVSFVKELAKRHGISPEEHVKALIHNINFSAGLDAKAYDGSDINREEFNENKEIQDRVIAIEEVVELLQLILLNKGLDPLEVFGLTNYYLNTTPLEEISLKTLTIWTDGLDGLVKVEIDSIAKEYLHYNPYDVCKR